MDCGRCGGSMMPETVIKLRRSLFGFRETRSQGAYCATCRTGVLVKEQPIRCAPSRTFGSFFSLSHSKTTPLMRRSDDFQFLPGYHNSVTRADRLSLLRS